jgi:hypothetical protein
MELFLEVSCWTGTPCSFNIDITVHDRFLGYINNNVGQTSIALQFTSHLPGVLDASLG